MGRRLLLPLALVLGISVAPHAAAQDMDLASARAQLQAGRDQIIREELQLSEKQLAAFWPLYEDYVAGLSGLRDRKAELIGKFLQAYEAGEFSAEFSEWVIEENFAIKAAWSTAQQDALAEFRKVIPIQQVARFLQLENKMDAEVDAQLALMIPLAE